MNREKKPVKAWSAFNDDGFGVVVYAETRGKARQVAQHSMDDCRFCEMNVRRCKPMDALYKGQSEADWFDDETRIVLVRDCGWYCIDQIEEECEYCPAREYCVAREDDNYF